MKSDFARNVFKCCVLALLFLSGCVRSPTPELARSMRKVSPPTLNDSLPLPDLIQAIESQASYLANHPGPDPLRFGPRTVARADYIEALRNIAQHGSVAATPEDFYTWLRDNFDFYEVYGSKSWGDVFVTGYFEPVIDGSPIATAQFSQPLYGVPADLVSIDVSKFKEKFKDEQPLRGRAEGKRILPYYSRAEIDGGKVLAGKGLELCYVDPVDAFFLQIQGSGVVRFSNGVEMRVGYGERNGQPYVAVGKFLRDSLPVHEITAQVVERHLRSLPPEGAREFMDRNPSYIFFQKAQANAVTYLGIPATAGRTIATDKTYFPKGGLAFLSFKDSPSKSEGGLIPESRFVLDQDIGGAIRGPGAVDLFWGRGLEAKESAGRLRARGRLYYLVPKTTS